MPALDIIIRRRNKNDTGTEEILVPATASGDLAFDANGNPTSEAAAAAALAADGWTAGTATWTYASATTFTVAGDLTETFAKGVMLKLTQTTVKYFYVVNSSHSAGTTTVTVTGGIDYSLANAAITLPFTSRLVAPAGFPIWFNFTPGITGFSANPSSTVYKFKIDGNTCTCIFRQAVAGTSNATSFTLTGAPVTAKTITNASWFGAMWGHNNGVTAMHFVVIDSGTSTFLCATAAGGGSGWTASGTKALHTGQLSYEF